MSLFVTLLNTQTIMEIVYLISLHHCRLYGTFLQWHQIKQVFNQFQNIHTSTACMCICQHFVRCMCLLLKCVMHFVCLLQRAVIPLVSPDVLYLFRVQAVCHREKRSDFSQTLLFKGLSNNLDFVCLCVPCCKIQKCLLM